MKANLVVSLRHEQNIDFLPSFRCQHLYIYIVQHWIQLENRVPQFVVKGFFLTANETHNLISKEELQGDYIYEQLCALLKDSVAVVSFVYV